jgi:hypothetical protein
LHRSIAFQSAATCPFNLTRDPRSDRQVQSYRESQNSTVTMVQQRTGCSRHPGARSARLAFQVGQAISASCCSFQIGGRPGRSVMTAEDHFIQRLVREHRLKKRRVKQKRKGQAAQSREHCAMPCAGRAVSVEMMAGVIRTRNAVGCSTRCAGLRRRRSCAVSQAGGDRRGVYCERVSTCEGMVHGVRIARLHGGCCSALYVPTRFHFDFVFASRKNHGKIHSPSAETSPY